MSDQVKGGGHPLITAAATRQIFEKAAVDGKFLGLSQDEFYQRLNEWQALADRSPAGRLKNTPFGLGDTWLPYWLAPQVQVRHSTADPSKTGDENLRDVLAFVCECLSKAHAAHLARQTDQESEYLGAAAHATQDSYSSAHVFRDPEHPGDPRAAIQAFNTFNWFGKDNTHEGSFDSVPSLGGSLTRATDKASALAVMEMFIAYASSLEQDSSQASSAYSALATDLFHGSDIKVFIDRRDPDYLAQREAHLRNEASGSS